MLIGEGLKVGALALLRCGCQVSMITSRESWRFRLSADPTFQERLLTIYITGYIVVCIHNCCFSVSSLDRLKYKPQPADMTPTWCVMSSQCEWSIPLLVWKPGQQSSSSPLVCSEPDCWTYRLMPCMLSPCTHFFLKCMFNGHNVKVTYFCLRLLSPSDIQWETSTCVQIWPLNLNEWRSMVSCLHVRNYYGHIPDPMCISGCACQVWAQYYIQNI